MHQPLAVPPGARVRYVDYVTREENLRKFPELDPRTLVTPDIVDDGFVLASVPAESQQFVAANHVLENASNPRYARRLAQRRMRMRHLKNVARKAGLAGLYDSVVSSIGMLGAAWNSPEDGELLDRFVKRSAQLGSPSVLELGTKRSVAERSTKHADWIPHAREYLGSDISAGLDVDLVADVHRLSDAVGRERFDVIISCSSFEHFKYPHLAAHEIMKVLTIGGLVFVQTHQSFPLHAYPYDYFRFSREAMSGLFGSKMGFRVIGTAYEFPARVYSLRDPASRRRPAYLNILLFGEKTAATPDEYIYEFE